MELKRDLTAKYIGTLEQKRKIWAIILHDTAGSGTHNDTRYLADPSGDGRRVSVDFTVERDGTIYQLNPNLDTNFCYHAGRHTQLVTPNRKHRLVGPEVNQGTIGIEIVQKADLSLVPLYPEAQVKAVAELCHYLCERFSLVKEDITTHQRVITDGSRTDPRKFPFPEFWTRFAAAADGSGTTSGVLLGEKVVHDVKEGDTLWGLAQKYATSIEHIKALNGLNAPSNQIYVGQTLIVKE